MACKPLCVSAHGFVQGLRDGGFFPVKPAAQADLAEPNPKKREFDGGFCEGIF
jgi:hypothetical protein